MCVCVCVKLELVMYEQLYWESLFNLAANQKKLFVFHTCPNLQFVPEPEPVRQRHWIKLYNLTASLWW